ncbi:DNA topoisomerase 4 subunit A [uncultured Defluviicoccus sp.]|uniref:DNA topoisomerase (ATP-hydrolyzing) n=1 Tax=metagenome TaxID=256318 RepID=A0A380TH60_9ZZZZ|nr:DNA topoisomerase 4 subunit A [uncultured Defluviicoccus sp.]
MSGSHSGDPETAAGIRDVPLASALSERYLTYALSTIVARSLPDARDGLKPVHRRLLYAMRQLKLDPAAGFKKCARVVGDVIGKYHPHGDVAVYDAMVRLAQDFALRYPLVDGHGNFGNIDGDGAAAMRYTEARLTAVAEAMLDGIDEETVDFRPTYDGEEEEPVVLPAAFPNLLANGATGIAVGMATSIPPHNVGELCLALQHLIRHPEASVADLLAFVPGPDFPTGGIVAEPYEVIRDAYATGRGNLRLSARWHHERDGGENRIVITEIPYQVQKSRLIEQIAALVTGAERLAAIADIRDQSTESVRLVVVLKDRKGEPGPVMAELFRLTDLEVRIGLNMNVLVDGRTPRLSGLRELLRIFLDHRFEVLRRRTRFRLKQTEARLEIVVGLLLALADLDTVIRIIREEDEPKAALMAHFRISDVQAEAILNMRLRQLRRLNEIELKAERRTLKATRADLMALLADDSRAWATIEDELTQTAARFAGDAPNGARRTTIGLTPESALSAAATEVVRADARPCTVVCSERGWLRVIEGSAVSPDDIRYKEGDGPRLVLNARRDDRLLIAGSNGRFYTLPVDRLPRDRGFGRPLRLMIDLADDHDVIAVFVSEPESRLLLASAQGRGFVADMASLVGQTRAGKAVLTLDSETERLFKCALIAPSDDTVAVIGSNRRLLLFPLAEMPVLNRGKGVILQRYRDATLADIRTFTYAEGLPLRSGRLLRGDVHLRGCLGRRGQGGHPAPKGLPAAPWF